MMNLAPIEDVIRAAERQAEIDWELEHRAPKPCEQASAQTAGSRCRDADQSGEA